MGDHEELEDDDEEDKYHRPRWCPDGLSRSQKRRVQRLRALEEAERLYLHELRKARPDLAAKIQRTLDEEGQPQRKEWCPKQRKADDETSAGTNMVFILPAEFSAPRLFEAPVAHLDCGPRPVIFEKPRERSYRHLKALYLRDMASSINFNQFLEKEKLKSNGSNFTDWFRHVRIFLNGGNLQYVLDAPLGDPPAETETDEVKNVYMTRKTRYKNFVMNYNMRNMNKEFPELFGMLKAAEIEIKKEHQVLMVNKTTSFKKQGKSKGKNKKSGKKAATPP
ncbi:hypothetical protein QYE76_042226 [Lolium multiflorum]|uniref:Uncharacterized protein n=1 Tax=Lolium multiflorum TaxID=4521 RepID=A0AAD8WX39_LOLMU|nr:hypothetical protein QYE76_042226 [Lolium multiflorum]